MAAENVAEEYLFARCPICREVSTLYYLSIPLLNKRVQDWGAGEWVAAGLAVLLAYHITTTATKMLSA